MQIPIKAIKVKKRARENLTGINELADSLKKYGLFNPIIINSDKVLIAGQRRLEAAKLLGWDTIEATIIPITDKTSAMEIEIEENLQRQQFTDEELLNAFTKLNRLKNPNIFLRIWNRIIRFFKNLFKAKTQDNL